MEGGVVVSPPWLQSFFREKAKNYIFKQNAWHQASVIPWRACGRRQRTNATDVRPPCRQASFPCWETKAPLSLLHSPRRVMVTLKHLFFKCSFAKSCWNSIGISYPTNLTVQQLVRRIKRSLMQPFFMEVIILLSRNTWTQRNNWIFNDSDPSVADCKTKFKDDFVLLLHRAKRRYFPDIQTWLENLSWKLSSFALFWFYSVLCSLCNTFLIK
jgi:hypothetical protein